MNLKVGDKVRFSMTAALGGFLVERRGHTGTLSSISSNGESCLVRLDSRGEIAGAVALSCLELLEPTKPLIENPMPTIDDIPKSLSTMERIKETPERKTLIKAGYIAAGEYTQKAKDLAIILFLETQTDKLVALATEELAEVKN